MISKPDDLPSDLVSALAALQAELDEVLQRYRRVGQGNPSAKRIAVYGFAYPVDLDNVPVREA